MTTRQQDEIIETEGWVERVTEKAVNVDGTWYSTTNEQRERGFPMPGYGEYVSLKYRPARFPDGKTMLFLEGWMPEPTQLPSTPAPAPSPSSSIPTNVDASYGLASFVRHNTGDERERRITRLACQRDAVALVAAYAIKLDPADKLNYAEMLALAMTTAEDMFLWAAGPELAGDAPRAGS